MRPRTAAFLALLCAGLALPRVAAAQSAVEDFKRICASCHTIGGGRLTGPDLKGVLEREDREWLASFIMDPAAKLDGGDPIAAKLLSEARGVRMPNQPGMSRARAEALLDLIDVESKLEKSQFHGVQLSDRPFTPADVRTGREIFLGTRRLANGGPACIACHRVGGLGGLGGGRLGPDLTKAFERYTDRKVLGTWLSAPATPTMSAVFADRGLEAEEILPLVAWFRDAAATREEDRSPSALVFFFLGLFGTGGALAVFARVWRRRFTAVRKPLVAGLAEEVR